MSNLYDSINLATNCVRAVERKQEYIDRSVEIGAVIKDIKYNFKKLSNDLNLNNKTEYCNNVLNKGFLLEEKSVQLLKADFSKAVVLDTSVPDILVNTSVKGMATSYVDKEVRLVW